MLISIILLSWAICGAIGTLYIVKTIDMVDDEISLDQFTVYMIMMMFGLIYMVFAIWFYNGVKNYH